MSEKALFWFCINLFCIFTQGFYSMLEMAAVSFNRVRLEYYVSRGIRRAKWLEFLLKKPSRLFGTVMLGVNIALQVGSQSAREFYHAIGLNPDWAILPQVFLVVIIAELAPLFAARRYAEHVVMLGIPIVYATYVVLAPLIALIGLITQGVSRLFTKKDEDGNAFLTRDELQKILESHEDGLGEGDEFNLIVSNIFSLKNKVASGVMTPLSAVDMIPSTTTLRELSDKWQRCEADFMPLYHKLPSNIVAIALPKDLVKGSDQKSVRDYARPPWFITHDTKLITILKQFRKNKQEVAVILNATGSAVGLLTLDAILKELFGGDEATLKNAQKVPSPLIERTLAADMRIADFNKEYSANLNYEGDETLEELMLAHFDATPETGESCIVGRYEFTVVEASLMGIKTISVRSI